jgi:hypothetical protein
VPGGAGGEAWRSPVVAGGRFRMMHRGMLLPPVPLGSRLLALALRSRSPRPRHSTVFAKTFPQSGSVLRGDHQVRSQVLENLVWLVRDDGMRLIGGRQSHAEGICTSIDHARRSHGEMGKAGGYLDSKAGRVARMGKLGGSLEEQAVAICPMHDAGTTAWDDRRATGFTAHATWHPGRLHPSATCRAIVQGAPDTLRLAS